MGGQNLSLQVHPLTEYIYEKFGMPYTQDESYYLLDADEDEETYVYLGLKEGVDKKEMGRELRAAEKGEELFPAEKYVNKIPVKKHDHVPDCTAASLSTQSAIHFPGRTPSRWMTRFM